MTHCFYGGEESNIYTIFDVLRGCTEATREDACSSIGRIAGTSHTGRLKGSESPIVSSIFRH